MPAYEQPEKFCRVAFLLIERGDPLAPASEPDGCRCTGRNSREKVPLIIRGQREQLETYEKTSSAIRGRRLRTS